MSEDNLGGMGGVGLSPEMVMQPYLQVLEKKSMVYGVPVNPSDLSTVFDLLRQIISKGEWRDAVEVLQLIMTNFTYDPSYFDPIPRMCSLTRVELEDVESWRKGAEAHKVTIYGKCHTEEGEVEYSWCYMIHYYRQYNKFLTEPCIEYTRRHVGIGRTLVQIPSM